MPKHTAPTTDIFTRLKELTVLRKQATHELLKERRRIDRQLNDIGYTESAIMRKGTAKKRLCKLCGKPGHNARTCPQNPKAVKK